MPDAPRPTLVQETVVRESLVEAAARRVGDLARRPLDEAIRRAVETCLLDVIGACAAARDAPLAPALTRFAAGRSGPPEAFAWSAGRRVDAATAAFANGALAHGLIREDMHVASGGHIGVLVIPAALALAEREGLTGRALIAGILAGYEVAGRLGTAIRRSGRFNRHLRPSGMIGAFGAAAAACAAAGLDAERSAAALSLAANFGCGFNEWAWSGGQEIFAHAGAAARNGLEAFDLARAGITASARVLEGRDGLFAVYGCGPDAARLFRESLDEAPCILGVRHKPIAGCNFVQTAVAAARAARVRIADPGAIESLVIRTFEEARRYPGCDYAGPFASPQQTKMSFQFGVTAALLGRRLDEATFATFDDPAQAGLMELCRIELDPDLAAAFPDRQGAAVEVRLRGGDVVRVGLDDVPWLGAAEVEARCRAALAAVGDAAAAARVVDAVRELAEIGDVRDLTALLPVAVGRTAREAA